MFKSFNLRINYPSRTSIGAWEVTKNDIPNINGNFTISSIISRIIKSVGKINLSTSTSNSSIIPFGYFMERSASYKATEAVLAFIKLSFLKIDKDMVNVCS